MARVFLGGRLRDLERHCHVATAMGHPYHIRKRRELSLGGGAVCVSKYSCGNPPPPRLYRPKIWESALQT